MDSIVSVLQARLWGIQQLRQHSLSATLDAELLLAHALQQPRSYLLARTDQALSTQQWHNYQQYIARRQGGEPVAYILGRQEFWSLTLTVNKHTLIPRPETEILVEQALQRLPAREAITIADLGTGSGAIALALASERPGWHIVAVDCALSALEVAASNLQTCNLPSVTLLASDWGSALAAGQFDAIISNPPYIAQNDQYLAALQFEPQQALVAGDLGLSAITRLLMDGQRLLKPRGLLLLEHGLQQEVTILPLAQSYAWKLIEQARDLAGISRVLVLQKP